MDPSLELNLDFEVEVQTQLHRVAATTTSAGGTGDAPESAGSTRNGIRRGISHTVGHAIRDAVGGEFAEGAIGGQGVGDTASG